MIDIDAYIENQNKKYPKGLEEWEDFEHLDMHKDQGTVCKHPKGRLKK